MLVIHRKPNEAVVLTLPDGRTIRVVVADVSRGKCRLGVEAPRGVLVLRSELLAADEVRQVDANIDGGRNRG